MCTTILYSLIILQQLSRNGKSDTSYRVIIKNSRKYIHVHKFLTFEHESRIQTNYFMNVLIRKCLINNYRIKKLSIVYHDKSRDGTVPYFFG